MLYSFCYFVVFFHLLWLVHCASDDQNQNQKDPAGIDLMLRIGPPNVNSESYSNVEVTQVHPVQEANAEMDHKSKRPRKEKVQDADRVKRRRLTNKLAQQRYQHRTKSGIPSKYESNRLAKLKNPVEYERIRKESMKDYQRNWYTNRKQDPNWVKDRNEKSKVYYHFKKQNPKEK